jgi:hypothetical protein
MQLVTPKLGLFKERSNHHPDFVVLRDPGGTANGKQLHWQWHWLTPQELAD